MRAKRATRLQQDASPVAFPEVICKLRSTSVPPAKYKPFRVRNLGIFRPNLRARLSSRFWSPTELNMKRLFSNLSRRQLDQNKCPPRLNWKTMQSQQIPFRVLVVQKRPDWMRRKLGKVAMRDCFGLDYALIAAMRGWMPMMFITRVRL